MKTMTAAIKRVDLDESKSDMREICQQVVQRTIRDCSDFGDFKDIQEFMGTLESLADNSESGVKTELKDAMEIGQSFDYFTNLK